MFYLYGALFNDYLCLYYCMLRLYLQPKAQLIVASQVLKYYIEFNLLFFFNFWISSNVWASESSKALNVTGASTSSIFVMDSSSFYFFNSCSSRGSNRSTFWFITNSLKYLKSSLSSTLNSWWKLSSGVGIA